MRRWVILPGGFWKSDFTYYFGDENIAFFRYFNFFGWDTNLKFANLYIKKSKVIFFWYYYLQVILFKIIRKWSPKKNINNKKNVKILNHWNFHILIWFDIKTLNLKIETNYMVHMIIHAGDVFETQHIIVGKGPIFYNMSTIGKI